LFATEAERLRGCIGCEFITQLVQYYPACEGSPEHLVMEVRLLATCSVLQLVAG